MEKLRKCIEGLINLDRVPVVATAEKAKKMLWAEQNRVKRSLDRVCSHIQERLLQIEITLMGESPEYENLKQLKHDRQQQVCEISGTSFSTDHPQPVALLPLNLAKDTMEALNVVIDECPWFGKLIHLEDISYLIGVP